MSNTVSPEIIPLLVSEKPNLKELCKNLYHHPQFKWIIVFILFIIGLYFYLVINKKSSICPFNNNKSIKIRKLDTSLLVESDEENDNEEDVENERYDYKNQSQNKLPKVIQENNIHNNIEELINSSEEDLNLKNQDLTTEEMREIDEQLEDININ
jgi:hypothetical protein